MRLVKRRIVFYRATYVRIENNEIKQGEETLGLEPPGRREINNKMKQGLILSSVKEESKLYGMSIEKFLENAEPISDKKRRA